MTGLGPERVKAATAWRFAYLAAQGGLSTGLLVCLAQVLPPAAFAAAALALGILVIAQTIGDFGVSQAAVTALPRQLAAAPEHRADLLSGAARASLWAALAGVSLALLSALTVDGDARLSVILIAPAAGAAVVVAAIDGVMRAEGEFRRPVELLLLSRLGSFVAVPLAAATDSAAVATASVSAGAVVCSLPALVALFRVAGLSREPRTRSMLRASVPLGVSQLLVVGTGRLNTIVVGTAVGVFAAATFEGTWRLYQLGQYVAGGIATAAAPFIGNALGSQRGRIGHELRRGMLLLLALGVFWMLILLVARRPVSDALFGDSFGPGIADAVVPLALVTPLAFVAFLAMVTLAASHRGRMWVVGANGVGALVNLVLLVALLPDEGAEGAAVAAASAAAVTSTVLLFGFTRAAVYRAPSERQAGSV